MMDQEKDRRDDVQDELYDDEPIYGEKETQEETERVQRKPEDPLQLVHRVIDEMIDYVSTSKKVFFTQNVIVEPGVMIDNLRRIWELLPEALTEAENVLKERDRILRETNEYAVNTTRDADNKAQQLQIDATNEANRVLSEANTYYAQHKDEGDAYFKRSQEEGDAYVKKSQQQGDAYVRDKQAWAENYALQKKQEADMKLEYLTSQENVLQTAQAKAQLLKNQTAEECNARLAKATEDANAIFGAASTQAQMLLRDLNQFQKQQNQALQAYCEDFEKRVRAPQTGNK